MSRRGPVPERRRDDSASDGGDAVRLDGGDAVRPDSRTPRLYDHRTTTIARTATRVVVPIILLTAISLLLQGHNLPGGGFIGAVLTVTAFALVYVIFGIEYLQSDLLGSSGDPDENGLVSGYRWLFGVGLALAVGSGLAPILFGYPFLTQAVVFVEHLPLYGELEVASALAFDLGVYFTVVGALLTVLAEVGSE